VIEGEENPGLIEKLYSSMETFQQSNINGIFGVKIIPLMGGRYPPLILIYINNSKNKNVQVVGLVVQGTILTLIFNQLV
jgi:hypothetical protein